MQQVKTQDPKYDMYLLAHKYQEVGLCSATTGKPIPSDEPVFILRAKDKHSLATLIHYKAECNDEHHKQSVDGRIQEFLHFQTHNPELVREPDTD